MTDLPAETRSRSARRSLTVAWAAGCAFISNVFVSNDWCFGAFTALLVGAVVGVVVDGVVQFLSKRGPSPVLCKILGILAGVTVGCAVRLTETKAFRIVFETAPPTGVADADAERWYAGGPGDEVLLMDFKADEADFAALLAVRGFEQDREVIQLWNDVFKDHKDIWEHVFDGLLPDDHRWHALPAPTNPVVYRGGDGITPRIIVLWDADARVAYVMYSVG